MHGLIKPSSTLVCTYKTAAFLLMKLVISFIGADDASGTGESLVERGCLLGCLLVQNEVMWSRSSYLLSRNSNILLRLCLNGYQSWISDVGNDWC